jgi:hypothetical protein
MANESEKREKTARHAAPEAADRKARLAEALRANLRRRKDASAKTQKPGAAGQNSET